MNELSDIEAYSRLLKLLNLFEKVKQVSWNIAKTKERYPTPESMTKEELDSLFKFYLALGFDLDDVVKEWKLLYEEFTGKKVKITK